MKKKALSFSKRLVVLYAIAILLGAMTGCAGALFQLAILHLSRSVDYFIHQGSILTIFSSVLVSTVFVYLAWWLVIHIAPEASGSGVPEIEGALMHKRPIFWKRLLPVKFIGGVLSISGNMVVGREGPTIQMGGNLGAMLADIFKLTRLRKDNLISAGGAAGLAAAFNAPLAGILFVVEEMRQQFRFNFTNFTIVAICCIASAIMMQTILGPGPALPMAVFSAPPLSSLWLFFIFGLLAGVFGLAFNKGLIKILHAKDKLSFKQQVLFVISMGVVIGVLAQSMPSLTGGGYQIINQSLTLLPSVEFLMFLIIGRLLLTLMCYATGVPGGIFAPLLALGTLLGLFFYQMVAFIYPVPIPAGMFAVVGMGALFAASVRAPITGLILVVEMTSNYFLILPLMISCLTATTVVQLARNAPIYTQLLRRILIKK